MSKRPVFLFTFANDAQHSLQLDEEWRQLERSLQADNDDGKLIFNLTPSTKKEDLWDKFNRFHDQIAVFHYGGHSDGEGLFLMKEKLHGKSLATLLGQEANLQLVFLNGCSNVAQVQQLLDEGVPAVIATEAPVHDHRAVQLARQFYQALSSGRTIREAFDVAAAYVNNSEEKVVVAYRGVGFVEQGGEVFPWGLYGSKVDAFDWKIRSLHKTPAFTDAEWEGVERQLELLIRKINRTREALALEDDPGRQVRYETQLADWEQEVKALREKWGL